MSSTEAAGSDRERARPAPAGAAAAEAGVWVDPAGVQARAERFGGLPVIDAVLGRLGFADLVAACLDEPDPRCGLPTDRVVGVVGRNLALGREPLYGLSAWAADFPSDLLGLAPGEGAALGRRPGGAGVG
jgi:hypothetical protein